MGKRKNKNKVVLTSEVRKEEVVENENGKENFTVVPTTTEKTTNETSKATEAVKTTEETTKTTSPKTTSLSNYTFQTINYDRKGVKNLTFFPEFIRMCQLTQDQLKISLGLALLSAGYEDVISDDGFVYAKGNIPVLLTAHMDTVHKSTVIDYYEYFDEKKKQHIISSPQGIGGDDRCGIYMILEIIKTHKCSVLFCEDEEVGGIGSEKFCKTSFIDDLKEMKYLIELDRKGNDDAVFYDCENPEFTTFIEENTGYIDAWGSFSDIGNLSPACGVASVNLSCGYHNAHTTSEYVVMEEMLHTIEVVKSLLEVECEQFEYIEAVHSYGRYGGYYGYGYGRYGSYSDYRSYSKYDDYDTYGDWYDKTYSTDRNAKTTTHFKDDLDLDGWDDVRKSVNSINERTKKVADFLEEKSLQLEVVDPLCNYESVFYISNGVTEEEAFGKFFMQHPHICFDDVIDWYFYDAKVGDDGIM